MSGSRKPALTLLYGGLALLLCLLLSALLRHETGMGGDEPYYERMAVHPGGPHNFPYAFRVGLPYLVHILPFGHTFSWELLSLLAGAGAAAALSALLRDFEVPEGINLALILGFAVSPPLLVQLLRNGRGVDGAAVLVITLGCLFIVRRQRLALALTLLAGTTVHESCLFLIPLTYAVWARSPLDALALRDTALTALAAIVAYLYIRATVVAVDERYQPGYSGAFLTARVDVLKDALKAGGWHTELRRLALVYGPLWLAAPLALRRLSFARRGLVLVALCVGSWTFALDWGRAIFFAAPVFYVAGAVALRQRRRAVVAAVIGGLALMDLGYAGYMQVHGVRYGLDTNQAPARGPVH